MVRMENYIVLPSKPLFCKRFVDDIFNRRKKNSFDELCHNLNHYHPKLKLTVETNTNKFPDTEILNENGIIKTRVYQKKTKLPIPWSSNIPKRYKRNTINTDLHRAKRISTDFEQV